MKETQKYKKKEKEKDTTKLDDATLNILRKTLMQLTMVLNYTTMEIVVHDLYSSDPFGNKCYGYIYGRITLDSAGAVAIIIHTLIFTFLDDVWTVRYTAALDNTGSDGDSVCGSSSSEDDDDDDDDDSGGYLVIINYLECLQT